MHAIRINIAGPSFCRHVAKSRAERAPASSARPTRQRHVYDFELCARPAHDRLDAGAWISDGESRRPAREFLPNSSMLAP
jgi:hypothetical protein